MVPMRTPMTDALHHLVSPFKRQLAALADQHAAGALSQAQWDAQRIALERRLLDFLLNDIDTPQAEAAAAPSWRLMAGLALVVVAIAAAGYAYNASRSPLTGETESADQGPNSAQVVAMVEQLAQRLKSNPQDADGWAMLARSYSVMERNDEALAAYQKAIALRKDDPGLLVDYADALAVKNQHSLQGEPMALVQRALAINPDHIKGLALAGTDAFVRKDFAKAVKYWERIEQIGAPESVLVQRVVASLQEARKLAGLPPSASTAQALAAPPTAPSRLHRSAAPSACRPLCALRSAPRTRYLSSPKPPSTAACLWPPSASKLKTCLTPSPWMTAKPCRQRRCSRAPGKSLSAPA
jgi:cytochrome c-type biogenesis protein CcmH